MQMTPAIYSSKNTPIDRLDPRLKIMLLVIFTVTVFLVDSWWGIAALATLVAALIALSRVSFKQVAAPLIPLYFLIVCTIAFNSYSQGQFFMEGFVQGCMYSSRMILLVVASLVICYTTSSTDQTDAFRSLFSPARVFRIPVEDIAFICSAALRFVPVMYVEFCTLHQSFESRGAALRSGLIHIRLINFSKMFVPLFVGLFRHADHLALAMDARCYGASEKRSSLNSYSMTFTSWMILLVGAIILTVIAIYL